MYWKTNTGNLSTRLAWVAARPAFVAPPAEELRDLMRAAQNQLHDDEIGFLTRWARGMSLVADWHGTL
ncbi:MAG TPA: hypothetical protein VM115_01590 [Vicinamibacterales bacterium]|nr:hypothetical protein [Vicinamibacterales bacterium]